MRNFCLIVLSGLLILSAGCGSPKVSSAEETASSALMYAIPRDFVNRQAYIHFTNASLLELLGDLSLANKQYAEALKYYPNSPELQYSYDETLLRLGQYRQVIDEIEVLDTIQPRFWFLMGDAYRSLGINDSARAAYREVVKSDSDNVSAFNMLAAYYQELDMLDSAIWAYENIASYYPSFRIYQEIANLYLRTGALEAAKNNYENSISMDSSDANVRSYLGLSVIYEEQGDRVKAKQFLEVAAHLSPNNVLIQNRLLGFYQDDNELDKALITAMNVVSMAPLDHNAARRLAILYFSADSLQRADSIFTALLILGDENLVNYYYLGRIAFLGSDFPKALTSFTRVTVMADSIVDGWLNLGLTYQEMDSLELEIATYEKSLQYMRGKDDSLRMMFMLASALERRRLYDRSEETFQKIISLDPNHSQSLNYLGYMLAERGERLEYAKELILKALKIMPENGAYLDSYAWVLYRTGDYKGALRELERAVKSIDNDPIIYDHLGDVYKALGDEENARASWKKALELDSSNVSIREKLQK